jgi:DNA-binding transcriptional MocR family regulator
VLADAITYQGISALCRSLGIDLQGLPADREGMRPDAFDAACAVSRPRAVFLVPSLPLSGFDLQTHENAPHAWLNLPEPWRGAGFARACGQRGVAVLSADAFAIGRETLAHAVRINVGAAPSMADLRHALTIIARLMCREGHLAISGTV